MIFRPDSTKTRSGRFEFSASVNARAHARLCRDIFREFWHGHTFHSSSLNLTETDQTVFLIGEPSIPALDGALYAIDVSESGVAIVAENERGLICGFMTLIDRIKPIDLSEESTLLSIDCCEIHERPLIENSMIHFCVFHNTELWELRRFVHMAAALKYSHIILEFWGMIKYDVMRELSWENAFTKDEIRPIIEEAHDLGLEIIPMFNHWGHASAGRVRHGKHVVLDQNPRLATLFGEDGWTWNIESDRVKALLRAVRDELCELCGEGEYFHLGCDEAYNFKIDSSNTSLLTDFLSEITDELAARGRRPIVWGDMLVAKHPEFDPTVRYDTHCPDLITESILLNELDRRIVIADWQYNTNKFPVETALIFKQAGFDVIVCPWDGSIENIEACAKTVIEYGLFGFMHTTWDTLSAGTPFVTKSALVSWQRDYEYLRSKNDPRTAALVRKLRFANGNYAEAGWARYEVGVKT